MRLERLENGASVPVPNAENGSIAPALAAPAAIDTEMAAATIFTRVAILCFVLLGALILRVLTQQNILGAGFGTILGFVYAGMLVVLSLIPGRFAGLARESSVFQCSGAVLAFVIAIESALRTHTLGRATSMIAITGFAFLSLGMGIQRCKGALAGTGIIGGILALVALDLKEAGAGLQVALVVLLTAAGIANSWREGWHWLRPVITLMIMLLLPAGFFFGRTEPRIAGSLLAASAGVWCAVLLQHLIAFRRLGSAAIWLPALTLWFAGMQQTAGWPGIGVTNGAIAAFAVGCVMFLSVRAPSATAGLAGVMATAALAGAIGGPMLDPTGLSCVFGGLALWFAGRRSAAGSAAVFATVLMLTAAGVGLAQLLRPPVTTSGLLAMSLSGLVLVFHYMRNSRTGNAPYSGIAMRLAPVSLAAGLSLLLGFSWVLLNRVFVQPPVLLLSQTSVLVITAVVLTCWGHAARRRTALLCGLGCLALALAKVLLMDLILLKSLNMLLALILVGFACVAVSVILRHRLAR